MQNEIERKFNQFSRYLLVYAHPDDETYTCASIQKLVQEGKAVDVVYVTSGDYQGPEMGPLREKEVLASMNLIGVSENQVHFLRIPERQLMSRVSEAKEKILALARTKRVECILSHDFEGGHNGHDAVSFCSAQTSSAIGAALYVFPAYYGWPTVRVYNHFVPPREATEALLLTPEQRTLKENVIASHATQNTFFTLIKESTSASQLFQREILRYVSDPIDFQGPPSSPIGYEYPGSKILFEDFRKSISI